MTAPLTAWDILVREEEERLSITTSATAIDSMLGGAGVQLGRLTEVAGLPGIGKTQLCMQLAVNVQIPAEFGGIGGEVVYVDAEGSFVTSRLKQLAAALVADLERVGTPGQQAALGFTIDRIFSRTYCFRVHDHVELMSVANQLQTFLVQHPNVKLVIIDSIACHFRQDLDLQQRSTFLNNITLCLLRVALDFRVAVLVTNQMTTKFDDALAGGGEGHLAPALGETWGHSCSNRLLLYWAGTVRRARLIKSAHLVEQDVPFSITEDGVRDLAVNDGRDGGRV